MSSRSRRMRRLSPAMLAAYKRMREVRRMDDPKQTQNEESSVISLASGEAIKAARECARELIRAANQDRRLIGNKDWQEAMIYVNRLVGHLQMEEEAQLKLFAPRLHSQRTAA